ncbi:MAG: UDP-N-acetylglucosamine 2-epimerase (non-hydrolyzing) [Candidatus Latescibacteria bacterium]|nr:UDP-N-acetylglucosamine 2-epimerase (non-hydrolyzing) [Candidatus Latescibacterota bacterium]
MKEHDKVILVVGTRPNFMKVAPILSVMRHFPDSFDPRLVHTGQHYDEPMSRVFFHDLGLPQPDRYLGVGGGSHATQTAKVMIAFEEVLVEERPDLVIVVGDVNSTVACALDAVKMGITTAHVEAGLRCQDRTMPEEVNRIVTDAICDLLFTPSPDADENLVREGIPQERIFFVGNVMIDTLLRCRDRAEESSILDSLSLEDRSYALVTLHRPSNVDSMETLTRVVSILRRVQECLPVVFPIHPRTRKMAEEFDLWTIFTGLSALHLTDPLGYLDFLKLQAHARVVLTDSGGIQEETTVLGVPCLTLRENTERPITVTSGTNTLVGMDEEAILSEVRRILRDGERHRLIPPLWDGRTAERIVDILRQRRK